jgi:hypothetical protein
MAAAEETSSSVPSHADSLHDRLSVVQQELASRRSQISKRERVTANQCVDALTAIRSQYHDIEERIALQSSDHRAELNLLDTFIREALFKVESGIGADDDNQHAIFTESVQIVEQKVGEIERDMLQGDGVTSEEEQLGAVRAEMSTAVEAARSLCEAEEEQAARDLAELIDPNHLKIRNLMELCNSETKQVERVVEDTRAQLLQLAAPPQSRLEMKQREIARGLREIKQGLGTLKQEREMTFATLYDAMTQLGQELIKKLEAADGHHHH